MSMTIRPKGPGKDIFDKVMNTDDESKKSKRPVSLRPVSKKKKNKNKKKGK